MISSLRYLKELPGIIDGEGKIRSLAGLVDEERKIFYLIGILKY